MNEAIGAVAAILTTGSFFPQVAKVWQTRSARDLSWAWVIMMTAGVMLWLVYGLTLRRLPLVLANAVTLVCLVTIAVVKGLPAPAGSRGKPVS